MVFAYVISIRSVCHLSISLTEMSCVPYPHVSNTLYKKKIFINNSWIKVDINEIYV